MAASAKKTSEQGWADKPKSVRKPLGAMSSRTLKDIQLSRTRPGMRDGQNATVRYETSFAKRGLATETLVLVLVSEDGDRELQHQLNSGDFARNFCSNMVQTQNTRLHGMKQGEPIC